MRRKVIRILVRRLEVMTGGGGGGGGGGAEKGFAVLRVEPGLNEVRTVIKRPPTQTRFQKKQKRKEGRGRNPVGN